MNNNPHQDSDTSSNPETTRGDEVKKDFSGLLGSLRSFLFELLDIRHNTDQKATIEAIIADIPFKGHTSWILICSIFIASVGLNANSTAVVIGAMLISPLMGPILGMGMSLAINDIDTLRRSLKNFGVMVVLSVLTAFLFFKFFPLRDESSELLARTAPDIRDVLIAFFGGLALVIARAKKGTIASVIFGVAIATALMPPLCTVGFGLAIKNYEYAWGALYLFTINTIFIGLATFLVLKLLRFPMVRYANSKKRKFIARVASLVAVIVMIPAGYTFYNVFQESLFNNQAKKFIEEQIVPYKFKSTGKFLKDFSDIEFKRNAPSIIELVFMGDEVIPENVIQTWKAQKNTYPKLVNTDLRIVQGGKDDSEQKFNYVNELYESKKEEAVNMASKIALLEDEVARLSKLPFNKVPLKEITEEARINYENLREIGFSSIIKTNFKTSDTLAVFLVKWSDSISSNIKKEDQAKLTRWLKYKLNTDKLTVQELEK
jgi:uncharacterized hydrophobic protein (TIGR00271 family)